MRSVSFEQIRQRLMVENPWWTPPHRIHTAFEGLRPRPYLDLLYPLISNRDVRRAVLLMGSRRVGKTVMMHHVIKELLQNDVSPNHICYFSVDHPVYNGLSLDELLEAYKGATETDYSSEECFVFFDEIQYRRDWETHLKLLVDTYPAVKAVASGSAAAALKLKSNESGAGRFTDFLLPPLTFHEYLVLLGREDLIFVEENEEGLKYVVDDIAELNEQFIGYMNFGGYPEVVLSKEIQADPTRYIKGDIVDKVLLRDLPSLYGIADIQELNSLFTTLALNTAQEISLQELSQKANVEKPTIVKYINYLEAAFLVKRVYRVDNNAKRFKRQTHFKVYLTNPSMRSALFSPIGKNDQFLGHLTETAIFAQWFHADRIHLHYARWSKSKEVDIVILDARQKVDQIIEIKWSDRYTIAPQRKLKSLLEFAHTHSLRKAIITTKTGFKLEALNSVDLHFIPASLYCFIVGYSIVTGKHWLTKLLNKEDQTHTYAQIEIVNS